MPVRKFEFGGDVNVDIGACDITGAFSFAAIVYVEGQVTEEYFQSYEGSPIERYAVGIEGGKLTLYRNGPSHQATSTPTKEWLFVGATKASGIVKPKLYIFRFNTETWIIEEGNNTLGNAAPGAEDITFGQWGNAEQFFGKLAAAAMWNTNRSEAEMKALVSVPSLDQWLTTSPKGMWFFNQVSTSEAVLDLTGNGADEISTENTVVIEEEPPIPYGEGEGGGGGDVELLGPGAALLMAETVFLHEGKPVEMERFIMVGGELVPL